MRLHSTSRSAVAALAALALAAPSFAAPQCPPDAFEPNDTCATAAPIGIGATTGLTLPDAGLDFYRFDIPAGQSMNVLVVANQPAVGQSGFLIVFRDDGSGSPCDSFVNSIGFDEFGGIFGTASLSWSTPANAPETFWALVQSFNDDCLDYDLTISTQPDPCLSIPPDAFEPNDDCATAAPMGVGSFPGLRAGASDPDHYLFTLAPAEVLSIGLSGLAAGERAILRAWDPNNDCGGDFSGVAGGVAEGPIGGGIYLANTTAAVRSFVVRVEPQPDQSTGLGFCIDYALSISSEIDPCGAITGDAFDPNSSCFTAAPLDSTQTDLKMHAGGDQDWYAIDVPARSTLRLRSKSTQNALVGPMLLWSACTGSNQDFLASSHPWLFDPLDPRHWLQWSNEADFGVDTRLFMTPINQGFSKPFCDTYQIEFELTLGKPFCLPTANSSGDAALLSASGSTQVGAGTLQLTAAPVPANTVGLVIFAPANKPPMAFGGGFLCLNGPIVRLPGSGTGAAGVLSTTVDWTGPAAALTAGESFSFQAWFRDPTANPDFDLSEGLEIAFQ